MSRAAEEMTGNKNWLHVLGVALHLGCNRTIPFSISAGEANCVRRSTADGDNSSMILVCIPEQPTETILSRVKGGWESLPGRVN